MFIICPKCFAKYRLPDDIDLKEGQKLKCSACGLVFEKGQEAPFVLEQPESFVSDQRILSADKEPQNNPPPEWTAPTYQSTDRVNVETPVSNEGVFRTPMFDRAVEAGNREAAGLNVSPASLRHPGDIIPEAFVPVGASVEKKPKKSSLILVIIYLVAIIGFCCAAWHYRDMLMPAFYSFMPRPTSERSIRPIVQESIGVPEKVVQSTQKNDMAPIKRADSGVDAPPVKEAVIPPVKADRKTVETVKPAPIVIAPAVLTPAVPMAVNPAETDLFVEKKDIPPSVLPVDRQESDSSDKPSEGQKDESATGSVGTVQPSASEAVMDADPLFNMVAEPLPTASETELSVQDVRFQVVSEEAGGKQLLVEGTLRNTASDSRVIPVLTATVWSKDSQILGQKKVHVTQEQIGAGEMVSFYTSFTPAPEGVSHVDVTF